MPYLWVLDEPDVKPFYQSSLLEPISSLNVSKILKYVDSQTKYKTILTFCNLRQFCPGDARASVHQAFKVFAFILFYAGKILPRTNANKNHTQELQTKRIARNNCARVGQLILLGKDGPTTSKLCEILKANESSSWLLPMFIKGYDAKMDEAEEFLCRGIATLLAYLELELTKGENVIVDIYRILYGVESEFRTDPRLSHAKSGWQFDMGTKEYVKEATDKLQAYLPDGPNMQCASGSDAFTLNPPQKIVDYIFSDRGPRTKRMLIAARPGLGKTLMGIIIFDNMVKMFTKSSKGMSRIPKMLLASANYTIIESFNQKYKEAKGTDTKASQIKDLTPGLLEHVVYCDYRYIGPPMRDGEKIKVDGTKLNGMMDASVQAVLDDEDGIVIVDEAHHLHNMDADTAVDANGYKRDDARKNAHTFADLLQKSRCNCLALLSGTPFDNTAANKTEEGLTQRGEKLVDIVTRGSKDKRFGCCLLANYYFTTPAFLSFSPPIGVLPSALGDPESPSGIVDVVTVNLDNVPKAKIYNTYVDIQTKFNEVHKRVLNGTETDPCDYSVVPFGKAIIPDTFVRAALENPEALVPKLLAVANTVIFTLMDTKIVKEDRPLVQILSVSLPNTACSQGLVTFTMVGTYDAPVFETRADVYNAIVVSDDASGYVTIQTERGEVQLQSLESTDNDVDHGNDAWQDAKTRPDFETWLTEPVENDEIVQIYDASTQKFFYVQNMSYKWQSSFKQMTTDRVILDSLPSKDDPRNDDLFTNNTTNAVEHIDDFPHEVRHEYFGNKDILAFEQDGKTYYFFNDADTEILVKQENSKTSYSYKNGKDSLKLKSPSNTKSLKSYLPRQLVLIKPKDGLQLFMKLLLNRVTKVGASPELVERVRNGIVCLAKNKDETPTERDNRVKAFKSAFNGTNMNALIAIVDAQNYGEGLDVVAPKPEGDTFNLGVSRLHFASNPRNAIQYLQWSLRVSRFCQTRPDRICQITMYQIINGTTEMANMCAQKPLLQLKASMRELFGQTGTLSRFNDISINKNLGSRMSRRAASAILSDSFLATTEYLSESLLGGIDGADMADLETVMREGIEERCRSMLSGLANDSHKIHCHNNKSKHECNPFLCTWSTEQVCLPRLENSICVGYQPLIRIFASWFQGLTNASLLNMVSSNNEASKKTIFELGEKAWIALLNSRTLIIDHDKHPLLPTFEFNNVLKPEVTETLMELMQYCQSVTRNGNELMLPILCTSIIVTYYIMNVWTKVWGSSEFVTHTLPKICALWMLAIFGVEKAHDKMHIMSPEDGKQDSPNKLLGTSTLSRRIRLFQTLETRISKVELTAQGAQSSYLKNIFRLVRSPPPTKGESPSMQRNVSGIQTKNALILYYRKQFPDIKQSQLPQGQSHIGVAEWATSPMQLMTPFLSIQLYSMGTRNGTFSEMDRPERETSDNLEKEQFQTRTENERRTR
tara:strand:+ start:6684 stop:11033 length:4350 start_codon:yes stop_codon:yes gene_type:complete